MLFDIYIWTIEKAVFATKLSGKKNDMERFHFNIY